MNGLNRWESGDCAIEVENLTRHFDDLIAVDGVNLQVPRGSVLGLLGVNGAGKSTLIKMLMGHLRPSAGNIRILGRDLKKEQLEIRRRVGYVSENRYLYEWMTVEEILRFTQAFHENWAEEKARELVERFTLPMKKKIRELSRGNRARVCLLLALAYNPELILLDEPTTGLDPIVRRDFLENIIWEIGQEGRTVLFSSHIVEEIERIADYVAIMDNGRILSVSTVEALKQSHRRVRFSSTGNQTELARAPGLLAIYQARHESILTLQGFGEESLRWLESHGVHQPELLPMSLEEIFVDSVRARRRLEGKEDRWEVRYADKGD
jgi:ABC-2 type transport system ATP-binding protein